MKIEIQGHENTTWDKLPEGDGKNNKALTLENWPDNNAYITLSINGEDIVVSGRDLTNALVALFGKYE